MLRIHTTDSTQVDHRKNGHHFTITGSVSFSPVSSNLGRTCTFRGSSMQCGYKSFSGGRIIPFALVVNMLAIRHMYVVCTSLSWCLLSESFQMFERHQDFRRVQTSRISLVRFKSKIRPTLEKQGTGINSNELIKLIEYSLYRSVMTKRRNSSALAMELRLFCT